MRRKRTSWWRAAREQCIRHSSSRRRTNARILKAVEAVVGAPGKGAALTRGTRLSRPVASMPQRTAVRKLQRLAAEKKLRRAALDQFAEVLGRLVALLNRVRQPDRWSRVTGVPVR